MSDALADAVDDAARSMATGVRQPRVENAQTLGDGLMAGLGAPNFELLREHRVEVVTCSEEAMVELGATWMASKVRREAAAREAADEEDESEGEDELEDPDFHIG